MSWPRVKERMVPKEVGVSLLVYPNPLMIVLKEWTRNFVLLFLVSCNLALVVSNPVVPSTHKRQPPFCQSPQQRRATIEEISYSGNIGTPGNYGCNMMLVDQTKQDLYSYTISLINKKIDVDQECVCWLKIGPDGGINGFFLGNEVMKFTLLAASSQLLAIDENTQGGCACSEGTAVPVTQFGQYAATWLEFDMANESNGGWSGADASCLVSAANGLDIPGLNVCAHDICSTIEPGGQGKNAYTTGMEALDGVGLNLPPGPVHLEAEFGYSGLPISVS